MRYSAGIRALTKWRVLPGRAAFLARVNSRTEPNLFFAELSRTQGGDVGETYSLTFRIPYHTAFYYCTHLIIHLHPPTHYLIASSVLSPLRLVLVSLHIGLRAQWIPRPSSASFSPLAANLCAPANHHRISRRRLHHRPRPRDTWKFART